MRERVARRAERALEWRPRRLLPRSWWTSVGTAHKRLQRRNYAQIATCLRELLRPRTLPSKSINQRCVSWQIRLRREAVLCRCVSPWKFLRGVNLDKGRIPTMIVKHGRAHIDEEVHTLRMREQPVFASRTKQLAVRAVHAADHCFAPRDGKALARYGYGQRVRTRAEFLTA